MTNTETPTPPATYDRFAIRSIEQLLTLPDGGHFLRQLMESNRRLLREMKDHRENFGVNKATGKISIGITYTLTADGDLTIDATQTTTPPKAPASKGAAYVDDKGQLQLMSPMMTRMAGGITDATPHDPITGEVRDV